MLLLSAAEQNKLWNVSLLAAYVIPTYAIACAVMDMIEGVLVRHNLKNDGWVRLVYRSIYVTIIAFVAVSLWLFIMRS